jgi:hypothetical protein
MSLRLKCTARTAGIGIVLLALTIAVKAEEFAKGTYSATAGGSKFSIKYEDGGKLTVSRDGEVVVEGVYKVTGDEIEVTDQKGPMSCGSEHIGKYKWKLDGKKLTFTKVQDECDGRAEALTSQAWMQQ